MSTTYIFDKVKDITEKFKNYFQHRKKIRALKNYAQVAAFKDKRELNLIEGCLDKGFLSDKASDFLGELLDNYKINYLDWSFRTRWLKTQMREMGKGVNAAPKPIQTTIFDFDKVRTPHVPLEVLAAQQANGQMGRRV